MNSLSTVSKALAGAVVAVIVGLLAKHGLTVTGPVSDALNVLIAAVIGFVGVYIAPKNRPS